MGQGGRRGPKRTGGGALGAQKAPRGRGQREDAWKSKTMCAVGLGGPGQSCQGLGASQNRLRINSNGLSSWLLPPEGWCFPFFRHPLALGALLSPSPLLEPCPPLAISSGLLAQTWRGAQPSSPARRCSLGRSNPADPILGPGSGGTVVVPGQARPQSPGRMLRVGPTAPILPPRHYPPSPGASLGSLVQNEREEEAGNAKQGWSQQGGEARPPGPSEVGAGVGGGAELDPERHRLQSASTPGWPWPNHGLLSQLLHPAWPKKKKKRKPPPRQLDMVQKPPGSLGSRKPAQEGVEGREYRGSVPRERDFRSGGRGWGGTLQLPGLLVTLGVGQRAAWKPSPGGTCALGSNPSSGESVGPCRLIGHVLGPRGRLWKQREAQRTGPFKSLSSLRKATHPQPLHPRFLGRASRTLGA